MANIRISQLPTAPSAITGSELIPIVQSGQTVQTTVSAIINSPVQTQTFLTKNNEPSLPNSRYLAVSSDLSLVDGGAQSTYSIGLTGAISTINTLSNGVLVKSGSTVISRTIVASGSGLSVTNGTGVSGNPSVALTGNLLTLASATGSGFVAINGSSSLSILSIIGTTNQISVANGDGVSGSPTIAIANNPIFPGNASATVPAGGTSARPVGVNGMIRYNSDINSFEVFSNSAWGTLASGVGVSSFSAGTTGFTPNTTTTGAVVLAGTLNVANGGTGATTLTGYVKGNGTAPFTANSTIPTSDLSGTITNAQLANSTITIGSTSVSLGSTITTFAGVSISGSTNTLSNIGNSSLTNSAITINGSSVSLGGSITVTATASNALTIGTGLSGTSYNGSAPVTIAIDSTVATLTGSQVLTNKSISGSTNTLSNIGNSSLTNSSLTVGTTNIALGATSLTLGGLTTVTVTQDPVSALQLATKQYVDSVAQGLDAKASVVNASTVAFTATYANGTAGVGATLTNAGTLVAFSADGVSNSVGDRVLIKNQATSAQNGIYTVTTVGSGAVAWVLTRSTDMDTWAEVPSTFVFVESGSTQADTGWVCTSNAGGTMGTTAITWVQFSGAGTYTAGTGLTLTGTQFSLTAPVTTALGGTGITTSPTAGAIVYGATTSTLGYTAIGTSGQPLLSAGAGTPTFGTLSVGGGGTGITTLTAGYIPYGAGTSAFASVSTFNYNTTNNTLNVPTIGTTSTTSVTPSLSFNGANTSLAIGATVAGSYLQVLAQNKSGTAGASVNYVLSNDLGTDSTYYGEFGMNSSVFSASTPADFFSINNGVYFSAHDGDVTIGSGNGFKTYLAWGTVGQSAHVINASGAIGLNTNLGTTPALSGTTNFGTSGQVLTSGGSSATPTWTTPNATTVTLANGSGATNYLVYAATATGNVAEYTSTGLTYNATNTAITGGINGGIF